MAMRIRIEQQQRWCPQTSSWTRLLMMLGGMAMITASDSTHPKTSRQIRIAAVVGDLFAESTAIDFVVQLFNSASNRSLLPDYDVLVDHYTVSSYGSDAPVEMVRIFSDDTPAYHAIKGPVGRADAQASIPLAAQARILHIHGGEESSSPPAARYPYSFTCTQSVRGAQATVFYIAASNGWRSLASFWSDALLLDAGVATASRLNITNFPTLVEADDAEWAVLAWQANLLRLIRSSRLRVVILFIPQSLGFQAICHVHQSRFVGIQYFIESEWEPVWYLQSHPPNLGSCTTDEMYTAAQGHAYVQARHAPPGLNLYNHFKVPAVEGYDESQEPYPCAPGWTIDEIYNNPVHLQFAMSDSPRIVSNLFGFFLYLNFAGRAMDAVCALIHALHDALYNKNVSLVSIEQRNETAFGELCQSMSQIEFGGVSGRMSFEENSGERTFLFTAFQQDAVPGRINGSPVTAAIFSFPNGLDESPEATLLEDAPPMIWRDGSTGLGPRPHLGVFPDCSLVNGRLIWDTCQPCQPGSAYDPDLSDCQTCPLGQFQNESGMRSCEAARPGWYILNTSRPSEAALCPVGHECPQVGTVMPQPCPEGSFAAVPGQAACDLCPSGRFGSTRGASSCSNCSTVLAGGITANIASKSSSDCICPFGTFRPEAADSCSPCPEGMHCPEGSDMRHLHALFTLHSIEVEPTSSSTSSSSFSPLLPYPEVKRGFMTRITDPLIVYKCSIEGHCPGGGPGSCASRRDSSTVACGDCVSDSYEASEKCKECGEADAMPMILAGLVSTVAIMSITLIMNGKVQNTPTSSLMIVVVTGLLFTSLQTMGVMHSMDVPWQEPVKSMLGLTTLLSFDLDMLKGACVTGVHPVRSFAFRQALALILVPIVLLTLVLRKYVLLRGKASKVGMLAQLCNSIGTLWSFLFISIVISATDPFICYKHPGGAGESVASAPSILCFEGGDHTGMAIIGALAMCLVPLPFLCLCVFAVLQYPHHIALDSGDRGFLHATRFLFIRYVPSRFFFHLLGLLRSLVVCMIPAIIRAKPAAQVLFTCVALCSYALAVDNLQPWRGKLCNIADAIMTLGLVILLLCGALFIEDNPEKEAIAALGAITLAFVLSLAVVAIGYAVWHRLAPTYFQYFICHHKGHAAAQARYLKILLLKLGVKRVFIDSDNLEELDALFDTVKSRVKHLVVLLTSDTLKRPWCVGEIVTALRAKIPITRLVTSSFVAPSQEDRESPQTFVDSTGCNLREYSITWDDVTHALFAVLTSEVMQVDLSNALSGTWRFRKAANAILKTSSNDQKVPQSFANVPSQGVLVATDPGNDEGSASAGILVDRIGPEVYRSCSQGIHLLCDHEQDMEMALQTARMASVVVIILSEGCLQSQTLLKIICEGIASRKSNGAAASMVSINIPGFTFPSPELAAKACMDLLSDTGVEQLTAFFRQISILLPTHAAQEVLNAQSDKICGRIQQGLAFSAKGLAAQPSSIRDTSSTMRSGSGSSLAVAEKMSGIPTLHEKSLRHSTSLHTWSALL